MFTVTRGVCLNVRSTDIYSLKLTFCIMLTCDYLLIDLLTAISDINQYALVVLLAKDE